MLKFILFVHYRVRYTNWLWIAQGTKRRVQNAWLRKG